MKAFGEWETWGRAKEGSVRPEVEGTFADDVLFTNMVLLRFSGKGQRVGGSKQNP